MWLTRDELSHASIQKLVKQKLEEHRPCPFTGCGQTGCIVPTEIASARRISLNRIQDSTAAALLHDCTDHQVGELRNDQTKHECLPGVHLCLLLPFCCRFIVKIPIEYAHFRLTWPQRYLAEQETMAGPAASRQARQRQQ